MSDDLAARLGAFDCCSLSDALDSLGLAGAVTGLVATLPGQRIAGRVHTVKAGRRQSRRRARRSATCAPRRSMPARPAR